MGTTRRPVRCTLFVSACAFDRDTSVESSRRLVQAAQPRNQREWAPRDGQYLAPCSSAPTLRALSRPTRLACSGSSLVSRARGQVLYCHMRHRCPFHSITADVMLKHCICEKVLPVVNACGGLDAAVYLAAMFDPFPWISADEFSGSSCMIRIETGCPWLSTFAKSSLR